MEQQKSSTDIHWSKRAESVEKDVEVNIMDIFQRELEYDYICKYLTKDMTVLEVGCGNGFSTERFRALVKHVDAFDYSAEMIERAKGRFGEKNNSFFVDNLLDPRTISRQYECVICVRVLINLRNLQEQLTAIENLQAFVKPGGMLILVEGFTEGFFALSQLRAKVGMPKVEPAAINFYSSSEEVLPTMEETMELEDKFHLGAYDFLTRVVYPLVVGPENAKSNTNFSESCAKLAAQFNPDDFEQLSRVKGFVFRKRSS